MRLLNSAQNVLMVVDVGNNKQLAVPRHVQRYTVV